MNNRYQVFVSSTYVDLQDERAEAIQALLELDCMPAGMELFPAANDLGCVRTRRGGVRRAGTAPQWRRAADLGHFVQFWLFDRPCAMSDDVACADGRRAGRSA